MSPNAWNRQAFMGNASIVVITLRVMAARRAAIVCKAEKDAPLARRHHAERDDYDEKAPLRGGITLRVITTISARTSAARDSPLTPARDCRPRTMSLRQRTHRRANRRKCRAGRKSR